MHTAGTMYDVGGMQTAGGVHTVGGMHTDEGFVKSCRLIGLRVGLVIDFAKGLYERYTAGRSGVALVMSGGPLEEEMGVGMGVS